jgi:outer membrane protein OmpA-like peptidoglycan-associated protein
MKIFAIVLSFSLSFVPCRGGFTEVLNSIALVCKEYKNDIEVAGHADSVGSIAANQALSQQRADSVASYLRQKGVSGSRLQAVGYGKSRPISNNDAENRRVEITLSQR